METTDDTHTELPRITPEKLTILKMKHGEMGRDFFSEPSTPTGHGQRSLSFADGMNSSTITRRSTGRTVSGSRRRSSFLQSHRSEMSRELTSQAEGKFFALMDLMSSASREASSLKESWARIVSEREVLLRERDELQVRADEVTETLERREQEFHHHGHESTERKKHVDKLLLELSVSAAAIKEHQSKVAAKDRELERTRSELRELRSSMDHSHEEHEALKVEMQSILAKLRSCEEDRDHAKEDSHKHHSELRNLLREHTDLKSKFSETTTKFESSRKEILTLNDRIKIWELERDEHLHEKDRLQEEHRRAKNRAEESARELSELTERHDRSIRDINKTKETLRTIEIERDEQSLTLENLRRDLKLKTTGLDEADERCADVNLKYEHLKREVISVKEKLREVELRETETREASDRAREQHRLVVIERDQLKDDLHDEHEKVVDGHRRIALLEDSLRRVESTITELRSEIHTLNERNKTLILEKEEGQTKHGHLHTEMNGFKEKILVLEAEVRIVTEARNRHLSELNDWKHKYEEVTETITEYRDDSGELEFEIESLRTALREAREQKERAISARYAADRERDEYISKYEEKCREMERFEESAAAHYHASSKGEGKSSFTRTVSSGTTIHHDKHSHHNHNSTRGGHGMFSP